MNCEHQQAEVRQRMVITGIRAVQIGREPQVVGELTRQAAQTVIMDG